ncbi:unnamed protein product [Musa textilis]
MPEQLMLQEEIFRSGVRTPSAPQIQKMKARLSNCGRIEGKNVFYCFQNHKARERQKLRRRLSRHYQLLYSGHSLPHRQFDAEEAPETNYETFGHEWTSMMMLPNRTFDLFPTTSTGLKDECATSESSSSTSIN